MNSMVTWQEIGWNGILLRVPGTWHPAVILAGYLLFEEDYRPVFEIRWQMVRGRFSAERVLRKLARATGDTGLVPWQPPPEWRDALSGCRMHGFQWQQAESRGCGLLLYNPATARSMLLRFHGAAGSGTAHYSGILESLREQPQEDRLTWAVFDIRARLPAGMRLIRHRFLPGSFTIEFRQDHLFLSLLRFRPAEQLLHNHTLARFGDHLAAGLPLVSESDPLTATWQSDGSVARRMLRRLQGKKAHQVLTLWHIPEKNVILGLHVKSNKPIPGTLIQDVRENYLAI